MIISTCILQIFLHSGKLFSVCIVKINTPKIGKILKVEINLSLENNVCRSIGIGFYQNWSQNQKLEYFLLKSKENLIIKQKPLFCGPSSVSSFLGHPVYTPYLVF